MPSNDSANAASSTAMTCCQCLLASTGFLCIIATVASAIGLLFAGIGLLFAGIAVTGCDLSCDYDTPGAVPQGEGYYDCDGPSGKQSCGWTGFFFYFLLILTGSLIGMWILVIACCYWQRHRRRKAAKAAAAQHELSPIPEAAVHGRRSPASGTDVALAVAVPAAAEEALPDSPAPDSA